MRAEANARNSDTQAQRRIRTTSSSAIIRSSPVVRKHCKSVMIRAKCGDRFRGIPMRKLLAVIAVALALTGCDSGTTAPSEHTEYAARVVAMLQAHNNNG